MMQSKYAKAVGIVLLIVFLVVINNTAIKETIRTSCLDLSRGILSATHFVFYNFTTGLSKLGDLTRIYGERDRLRRRVAALEYDLIEYEEVKRENSRLKALLDLKAHNELTGISAEVVGRDMSPYTNYIIINRGTSDGVGEGTVLINHEGLVGQVVSAGQYHARAMLITDEKERVCVMTQESREAGILEGTSSSLLKMRHLDVTAHIAIGDVVVTSGFGDVFPKGIPVGTVEMIATESNNISLYAVVKPFADVSKLEEVLCLKKE